MSWRRASGLGKVAPHSTSEATVAFALTPEQIQSFISHLAEQATKDRGALLCKLNSYGAKPEASTMLSVCNTGGQRTHARREPQAP